MRISPRVIRDINQNKVSTPKKKELSTEITDSVTISSGKEKVADDDFKSFLSKGMKKVADYTKPRPATETSPGTSADSAGISLMGASMGGAITGYFAGGHPVNAVGGAVGGAVGIKVGEKTESIGKAVVASAVAGAAANTAAVTGLMLAEAAIKGVSASFSPLGLVMVAAVGGLSGVSGVMQGSCMGDVKDGTSTGMILGATMSAMGGSPLLTLTGALAGATGGMIENKAGKYLASAGVGAALGAASGAIAGPVGMAVNAAMGATIGVLASAIGPKFGQVQRNFMDDIRKVSTKVLSKLMPKNAGITARTALGILGGAIMAAPMALLGSAIAGPIGAVVPILLSGALTGVKVNKVLRQRKKIGNYSNTVKDFFAKTLPKEQAENIPTEVIQGFSYRFTEKYKNNEEFSKITPDQFMKDVQEFERQAVEAQKAAMEALQAEQAKEGQKEKVSL